jgi:uncharacterized protein YdhG (YjbR/CyaY superfamily)
VFGFDRGVVVAAANRAPKNIDEYLAPFPPEVQEIMQRIRQTIQRAAPQAEETISYGIPCFHLRGMGVIYFAGYKRHIGIYPAPRGTAAFRKEVAAYKGGKGTVQLPLEKRIPYGLITRIVKYRLKEFAVRGPADGKRR